MHTFMVTPEPDRALYCTAAGLNLLCVHIKRVHMAGNAAKRKMRNLNWRNTQQRGEKKGGREKNVKVLKLDVNWTPVLAQKWNHIHCRKKLKCNFSFPHCWIYFCSFFWGGMTGWHCRSSQSLEESVYHP